ncbi:hypothetical protein FACS1894139_06410 [Planctomycetales bacterium]|nr:hypothetical protein FACS1894107_08200 [Planctomycetales bacterium]GHS96075.1 hypothetical protein FACS1894108_00030 [Planctomycetales bacterium]GHT04366.1 hypothetical protein FACS1894139_06410 [Planctomycetales bacterium]
MPAILVADMHLKPGAQPAQNAALRDFLREVLALRARRLILLGDAFNWWFERDGRVVGDYDEIFAAFASVAAAGVIIDHVSGNRDFMVGAGRPANRLDHAVYRGFFRGRGVNPVSRLTAAGINPRGFVCQFEQDGEKIFCAHGDMYALNPAGHGMMRWWTMSLPMRLFWALAPFAGLQFFFTRLQRRETLPYRRLLPKTELIEPTVLAPLADAGIDRFFCGHFHCGYRELTVTGAGIAADKISARATLHIIPSWLDRGAFAVLENRRLKIEQSLNES